MSQRLGLRIKALRRLKRVTQQELADMIEISVTLLSHIERGRRIPSPQQLEKIARQLDVPGEELFIIRECDDPTETAGLPDRANIC